MIKIFEGDNFKETIKDDTILVDFYADWCGPCKMMGEVLEKMNDVNISKVNVDFYGNLAREFGVMSIPTLILFKNGNEVARQIGFLSEDELRNMIKEAK